MLSSPTHETGYNNDKLGHVDWLRYVRLIASEKRPFSVFGPRKRRNGESGKSPTLWSVARMRRVADSHPYPASRYH
jgi:hypothetical protein